MKKYDLPENAEKIIIFLAKKYNIEKVILFGSRSRYESNDRSDIDIAVSGGNITEFTLEINDNLETLLLFDVVDLKLSNEELLKNIKKDGVIIYEKI